MFFHRFPTVGDYVHLNPVRAGLLPPEAALESFRWSSYGAYLRPPGQRPGWLRVDRLLGEKDIPKDSEAGRQQFGRQMERRRAEESAADYEQIRRDWVLGSEVFRQELLAAAVEQVGPRHYGAQRQETGLQKAEWMVKEELAQLGWDEGQLRARRKGHRTKVKLACRLRQKTTMSLRRMSPIEIPLEGSKPWHYGAASENNSSTGMAETANASRAAEAAVYVGRDRPHGEGKRADAAEIDRQAQRLTQDGIVPIDLVVSDPNGP